MAIASTHPSTHRRWPDLESALAARVDYDPDVDSLLVAFGPQRPAVNVPLTTGERDYVYLLVDLDTDEVVGVEIEDVRAWALARHPAWASLVATASGEPQAVPPAARSSLAAFLADIVDMASR